MCFFNFNKRSKNDSCQFNPLAGKSQHEISRIEKDSVVIKKECDEIINELKRTTIKDKVIRNLLERKLEDLQGKCLHVKAKRTHITGMVIEPCPICGYLDPSSNLYKEMHKKTPE